MQMKMIQGHTTSLSVPLVQSVEQKPPCMRAALDVSTSVQMRMNAYTLLATYLACGTNLVPALLQA